MSEQDNDSDEFSFRRFDSKKLSKSAPSLSMSPKRASWKRATDHSSAVKAEVDDLIEAGVRPAKIIRQLAKSHEAVVLPTAMQLHNRRHTTISHPESGWKITSIGHLDSWVAARLVDRL
jgi:hypothetical protein